MNLIEKAIAARKRLADSESDIEAKKGPDGISVNLRGERIAVWVKDGGSVDLTVPQMRWLIFQFERVTRDESVEAPHDR